MTEPKQYALVIETAAQDFMAKLAKGDKASVVRIDKKIRSLAQDPRPQGYEPVQSRPGHLRVRAGTYRIIYTVQDRVLTVTVVDVGHRSDVYK